MGWSDNYCKRKRFLVANSPLCVYCKHPNVELLEPYGTPAHWWCNNCKLHFSYEPEEE